MLTGLAHSAVCVPDVETAARWYTEVLGLQMLSPPYRMEGAQIARDMGELVPSPVVVHAAILGFGNDDRVIELIEYPAAHVAPPAPGRPSVTRVGITHVGMLCDDIRRDQSRARDPGRGVPHGGDRGRGGTPDNLVPRPLGDGDHPAREERERPTLLGAVAALGGGEPVRDPTCIR